MEPELLIWWNQIAQRLGGMFSPEDFRIILRTAKLSFAPIDDGFISVAWRSSSGPKSESFDPPVTRDTYSAEEAAERIRSTVAE
jgi:hypothetical protein